METVRLEFLEAPAVKLRLVGFRTTVGPLLAEGDTVAVRFTLPAKLFTLVRLTLNTADRPGEITETCGLTASTKSPAMTVMLAMKVDQKPPDVEVYSPPTQTIVGLEGSTPAPK